MSTGPLVSAISAGRADRYLLMMCAVGVAVTGWLVLRVAPRLTAVVWLASICFVPIWLGINFKIYWGPTTLVGIVVLAALAPTMPRTYGFGDVGIAVFVVVCLVPVLLRSASIQAVLTLLFQWIIALLVAATSRSGCRSIGCTGA